MPRLAGRFTVQKKSKRPGKFIFTINESSGLPEEVCLQWQRRAFSCLPPELAHFREPTSKTVAQNAVGAFIDFLKKEVTKGTVYRFSDPLTIGEWLIRFTSLDNNPRAERLISEGTPYSPGTVEELYFCYYNRYIAGDPILDADINTIDISSCRAWLARIGMKKCKKDRIIAGRRVYEVVSGFIRMAFNEYQEDNQEWRNPFDRIDAPVKVKNKRRDVLQEGEILKLFMPGVITDPLEFGVAVALYWAGLRRGEVFGLKTATDLDWSKNAKLNIQNAWKRFGSKKHRTLGDPKWHKLREAPFCNDLQGAILRLQEHNRLQIIKKIEELKAKLNSGISGEIKNKFDDEMQNLLELQKKNGIHEFVFCYPDGSIPHGKWILEKLPVWMKKAGIDPAGRRIVPHSARHSLASTLEAAGVPLRYLQDILGHSSMETTIGYLHTPQGMINKLTKKIGEVAAQKESEPVPDNVLKIGDLMKQTSKLDLLSEDADNIPKHGRRNRS